MKRSMNKSYLRSMLFSGIMCFMALVQVQAQTYSFSNAGATGRTGPTQTQVNTAYSSTNLSGAVSVSNGIQIWVVPSTGLYRLEATGASGGGVNGGMGAFVEGEFLLSGGDTILIIVGQMGIDAMDGSTTGGGGTFIVLVDPSSSYSMANGTKVTPLLIAGGGGGNPGTANATTDASLTTSGLAGTGGTGFGAGGTNGNGGKISVSSGNSRGGGGGGFLTDGERTNTCGTGGLESGYSFLNGGNGGITSSCATPYPGGFGGGGGAISSGWRSSGGGGGYSGGGAGQTNSVSTNHSGGGGACFNSGSNKVSNLASQTGHGLVEISTLSSGAHNDAGVISIDSPTVYCSGVHNVVATVQNFGINIIDSVTVNWSVDGVAQTPLYYAGTIDTIGGQGDPTKQLTLGSYTFTSSAHNVMVWTSKPNGGTDTVNINDTAKVTKQANLPPPTGLTALLLNHSNATLGWNAGSVSNTWAYVNSTTNVTPTGPGTTVSNDSVYITGLTERTTYYFYVREICASGDSSVWAGPLVYKTPCANILNGVYTIDPGQATSGTNFISFTDAVDGLIECGVSGPVEFHVVSGTFNERLEIPAISGASSTNTIRFIGAGKTSTILSNAGTATSNFVTVMLDGADYLEFRDMTIRGTGSTYAVAVMFTNEADYNSLRNVDVEVNTSSSSTNTTAISFSGSKTSPTAYGDNGDYNVIDSVNITGGYYGIRLNGSSQTLPVIGNRVSNTRIENYYFYGIYNYYNSKTVIDKCFITTNRNTTNADGIFSYYLANGVFTSNIVRVGDYGIYFSNLNVPGYYDGNEPTIIANNMISSTGDYGVYIVSNGGDLRFINNSVNTSSGYSVRMNGGSNIVMMNNHIRNYRTNSNSYTLYTSAGFDSLDYNNYIFAGSGNMIYKGSGYADFASYQSDQALFGFEEHSASQDPTYTSNTDLHIDHSVPALRGADMGITHDIDGDLRCEIAPTVGADESEYVDPSPTAGIAASDTIYINSPTTFFSTFQPVAGVLWEYTWYVDDVQQSKSLDFEETFTATGTYEVKLRARSCSGEDRDSIVADVVNPTSTPVTDFTASKLVVDVLEGSVLSDLSDFGATQWEWTADPASDAFFSDAFSSNPTVFFLTPGVYEICLQTANGAGQGTKLCKSAYISVNDDAQMCFNTESTLAAGRITDDGGPNGNYSANSNCNFYIHPCASEVTLRFTQWNLSDADDELSVYDGSDNTGTLLGTFNSNSNLPGGASGLVASSGKMYLEWRTSPAGQTAGFTAYWTSKPDPNVPLPTADFTTQDTVFIDQVVTFTSTSTGAALNYSWDFDPPFQQAGLDGGDEETDRYSWSTAGTYPVQLTVNNCGGTDAVTKNIQVIAPTSAPVVGFYADRIKAPVLSTVTLKDSSFQGGTSWKWTITPAATTNMLTPDNGQELKVAFIKSGKYTVKLVVTNSVGSDSLTRVDYIEVFDYCAPVVGNVSSDVAISRVKFRGIDNYSAVGTAKYTSYLNDFTPEVLALRDSVTIRIERQSTTDPLNRKVWIDWNNDGDFNDAGEEVASESSSRSQSYTSTFVVPSTATLGFTTLRVGVSYDQDDNKPCGINPTGEFEDYPIQIIIDNQAPVITMNGADSVWVEKGYQYLDAGATAMDNVDGDLTPMIITTNPVDSTVVGTYVVRYNVSDMDGNAATEVTRIVMVTPDVTAPVITLNGSASVDVTVGTNYADVGATAEDYFQQSLTHLLQFGDNIDINVLGTYYFWYTVEDAAGNRDSVARVVNVVDDIAPQLTLLGANPLVIEVKTNINEPGYTVTDNHDQNVQVTIDSSAVNKNQLGLYPMTYTATDASGNTDIKTRMVSVEDNTAPVVTLIGNDTVIVDVFDSYNEQGVQVQDNFCTGLSWNVDQQPNTSVLGDYTLTYTSTDCNGNTSTALTRVVRVVDREAPVLTLNGFAANTMYRWDTYNDPGVTIDDNYYSEAMLQDSVKITGNFDPNWVGFYSICYTVTDPSGNKSTTVCRSIRVLESITSLDEPESNRYRIYPNPSNGAFTLSFGENLTRKASIKIYDMAGKVVAEMQASAGMSELPMHLNLAKGVYRVAVSSDNYHQVLSIQVAP